MIIPKARITRRIGCFIFFVKNSQILTAPRITKKRERKASERNIEALSALIASKSISFCPKTPVSLAPIKAVADAGSAIIKRRIVLPVIPKAYSNCFFIFSLS